MRVAFAADHAGWSLRARVLDELAAGGHELVDCGTPEPVPGRRLPRRGGGRGGRHHLRPRRARDPRVRERRGRRDRREQGGRASARAMCHDSFSARQGVEDDNMNILCLGARVIGGGAGGRAGARLSRRALLRGRAAPAPPRQDRGDGAALSGAAARRLSASGTSLATVPRVTSSHPFTTTRGTLAARWQDRAPRGGQRGQPDHLLHRAPAHRLRGRRGRGRRAGGRARAQRAAGHHPDGHLHPEDGRLGGDEDPARRSGDEGHPDHRAHGTRPGGRSGARGDGSGSPPTWRSPSSRGPWWPRCGGGSAAARERPRWQSDAGWPCRAAGRSDVSCSACSSRTSRRGPSAWASAMA